MNSSASIPLSPVAAHSCAAAAEDVQAFDLPQRVARYTRFEHDAAGRRIGVSSLRLSGITCAACAMPIELALRGVDGVREASVNAAASRALVRWDAQRTRPSELVRAVRDAGYDAAPDTAIAAREMRRTESRQSLWRFFVAAFCAMQVMMFSTPAYVAGPAGIEPDLKRLLDWGSFVLALPVMLFSAGPFFSGAWRALRSRRIGMDVPVALGIAVSFLASTTAALDPGGPLGSEVYFDSLTMFVAFLLGARALEMRVRHRAAQMLETAMGALPESTLRLREDGRAELVDRTQLRPGDRVRVPLGQGFAADGRLIEGETAADESLLSGESAPVSKGHGDEVVAGSVNLLAPVVMRVERTGEDTRHEAIVALMREAQSQRGAASRAAERWAGPFLWAVLALALGAALAWQWVDPQRAAWVAVSVLVVTCPCALSLAAPSALLAAADALARRGVLMRRLESLEPMARITHLFVDKTGTLTAGRSRLVQVQRVSAASGPGDEELLDRAAALAAWSQHPLSKALCEARPWAVAGASHWRSVRERAGEGLEGLDEFGAAWRLGCAAWLARPAGEGEDESACAWFGPAGNAQLRLQFEEALRPDAVSTLHALRREGVRVTLLSGDAPHRVDALAAACAIEAHGGASPAEKLQAVRSAQALGATVAMLGDGINDAAVLAQADVALAMGSGAMLARSQADAVLMGDRLAGVLELRRTARRCMRITRQNLVWAAAYNAVCVPLALAGALPPWAAGAGMAASSLLVMLNALRVRA